MRRKRRTVKDVTYFEKVNIVKRLREMFKPEILDALGCMDFDIKCAEIIWSEICDPEMEYSECLRLLMERYSLLLKEEVKLRKLEMIEYSERQYISDLKAQIINTYDTDKISELYKRDVVRARQRVCEYVVDYTVNDYVYGHEECRDEYVDEIINWNELFIEQPKHILTLYMKDVYKCRDVYEIEMFKLRIHLEDSEDSIVRFTEQFARMVGLAPTTMPEIQLATPKPFLWIVTLRNTELDDKLLVCERAVEVVEVYDPLERPGVVEIREEPILLPLTHKFKHVIGVIAWLPKPERIRGYYALLY